MRGERNHSKVRDLRGELDSCSAREVRALREIRATYVMRVASGTRDGRDERWCGKRFVCDLQFGRQPGGTARPTYIGRSSSGDSRGDSELSDGNLQGRTFLTWSLSPSRLPLSAD